MTPECRILRSEISRVPFRDALELAVAHAEGRSELGGYACFVNAHTVTEGSRDRDFQRTLDEARWRFPDGVPLVWASRWLKAPIPERVCGPDFMAALAPRAGINGLIGGRPGDAEAIARRLSCPVIAYSPPFRNFSVQNAREDWQAFLSVCPQGRAPRIVWVGLGAPKQERWMHAVTTLAPETLFLGVGAAFDFFSGRKKRGPAWMQRVGLEWLYRLGSEPGRLLGRYLGSNSRFILGVLRQWALG